MKSFFVTTLTAGALVSVAARTDSGIPGAGSDVITTATNKRVYVYVTSTQRNSPRETNPANCARSLTAKLRKGSPRPGRNGGGNEIGSGPAALVVSANFRGARPKGFEPPTF